MDRDLLLMGVFLHDAGKMRELTYARAFGYSDEGQLVGHIAIGVEMLTEQAREGAGPDRRAVPAGADCCGCKHMILSHHGDARTTAARRCR